LEEARIDEIVEHTRDLVKDFLAVHMEKDEAKKVSATTGLGLGFNPCLLASKNLLNTTYM
jgi:hypothetical protein